jgi:hypothetical protein
VTSGDDEVEGTAEATEVESTSEAGGPGEESVPPAGQEPDWVRRRRLDAAFGDDAHSQSLGDRWYRDQVPPHHG